MDGKPAISARWVIWLTAAATLVFTVVTLMPQVGRAIDQSAPPSAVFALVGRTCLIDGAIAGLAGWLILLAVTRRLMIGRGLLLVFGLIAAATIVNLSATGWLHTIATVRAAQGVNHATQQIYKAYRLQKIQDRADYLRDLKSLGYPAFLYPASLAKPHGLADARSKIEQARAVVAKYRALSLTRRTALTAKLNGAAVNREAMKQAQTRLDGLLTGEDLAQASFWQARDKAMADYQAMLDDLADPDEPWRAAEDKVYFHSHADVVKFQKHLQAAATSEREANDSEVKADQQAGAANLAELGALHPEK